MMTGLPLRLRRWMQMFMYPCKKFPRKWINSCNKKQKTAGSFSLLFSFWRRVRDSEPGFALNVSKAQVSARKTPAFLTECEGYHIYCSQKKNKAPKKGTLFFWRRVRDSNPRWVSPHSISSAAPSTTRTTLHIREIRTAIYYNCSKKDCQCLFGCGVSSVAFSLGLFMA